MKCRTNRFRRQGEWPQRCYGVETPQIRRYLKGLLTLEALVASSKHNLVAVADLRNSLNWARLKI